MVNGIFAAELALYLVLLPPTIYNFWSHRWSGFLAWYGLALFCGIRIAAGAIGVTDNDSITASILIGIGTSPLILSVDGLVHEAYALPFIQSSLQARLTYMISRTHRNPYQKSSKYAGWAVIYIITGLMAAAIALTVTGAMDIYKGDPKPNSVTHWKAGSALIVVAWFLEVAWASFSLLPSQADPAAPSYRMGSTVRFHFPPALSH